MRTCAHLCAKARPGRASPTFFDVAELLEYQWVDIDPYQNPDTKQPLTIEAKREKYPAFVEASPRGLVPVTFRRKCPHNRAHKRMHN